MYEVLKKLPDGCDVQLHNTGSIPIADDFYEKLVDKILNNVILVKCSIKGDNSANKPESMFMVSTLENNKKLKRELV